MSFYPIRLCFSVKEHQRNTANKGKVASWSCEEKNMGRRRRGREFAINYNLLRISAVQKLIYPLEKLFSESRSLLSFYYDAVGILPTPRN